MNDPSRVRAPLAARGVNSRGYRLSGRRPGTPRLPRALLQSLGAVGQRALLLYPPGLDYISAFFGCLYAGVVAVPVYPPRHERGLRRLETVAADAGCELVLSTAAPSRSPPLASAWRVTGAMPDRPSRR